MKLFLIKNSFTCLEISPSHIIKFHLSLSSSGINSRLSFEIIIVALSLSPTLPQVYESPPNDKNKVYLDAYKKHLDI